MYIWQSNL